MQERSSSHRLAHCPQLGFAALEKELADLSVPVCEEDDEHLQTRDVSDCRKPFAAFGSYRQRHGDYCKDNHFRTIEAPAKLQSSAAPRRGELSRSLASEQKSHGLNLTGGLVQCSRLIDKLSAPSWKYSSKERPFSTDLDREEAWERKKAQYLPEEDEDGLDEDEEYGADEGFYDALSEHASEGSCSSDSDEGGAERDDDKGSGKHIMEDTSHVQNLHMKDSIQSPTSRVPRKSQSFRKKALPSASVKPMRTRSLTDEDLEELRGSIDLGFGFSYNEGHSLTNTLPALELYYAIKKNYVDARSSPVSPLEGNALLRTNSEGSTSSPSSESWRISSPGDHPSQVKTRLRHWAQAVACSVKQGY